MADVEKTVRVDYKVEDHASSPLSKMAEHAKHTANAFDRISGTLGGLAGLAGLGAAGLGMKSLVEHTVEHLKTVQRIGIETGISATKAEGLMGVFTKANIEGPEAERILMGMGRRALMFGMAMQKAGQSMREVGGGVGGRTTLFKQMGVDIKAGPEAALKTLATRAEQGKLSTMQLSMAMGVSGRNAVDLMKLLSKGPKFIDEATAEAKKHGSATAENMKTLQKYNEAQIRIKEAWARIQQHFGVAILPLITKLMDYVSDHLEGWEKKAQAFGETLSRFLKDHYNQIIAISKVLMANAALTKVTGKGIGGIVSGAYTAGAKGGGVAGGVASLGASLPLIGLVVAGLNAVVTNFMHVGEFLSDALGDLTASLEVFWGEIEDAAGPALKDLIDTIREGFSLAIPLALHTVIDAISFFVRLITTIVRHARIQLASMQVAFTVMFETLRLFIWALVHNTVQTLQHPGEALATAGSIAMKSQGGAAKTAEYVLDNPWGSFMDEWRRTGADAARRKAAADRAAEAGPPDKTPPIVQQDFRGSTFNVRQDFAEGFDPDRIAAVFSADLGKLADRKLQSGFAPLYSVRVPGR